MKSTNLFSNFILVFCIGIFTIFLHNKGNSDGNKLRDKVVECIKEFSDTITNENHYYRNVDVAVFSDLNFEESHAKFSVTRLLGYEELKFVNYTHIFMYNNRPVLIRFNKSVNRTEISKLNFIEVKKDHYIQIKKDYFDTTIFITGTSKAVIFNIENDQVVKTWFKMFEQLPLELWPFEEIE
jgi:hypothetical protein